jgi:hypothetical protein
MATQTYTFNSAAIASIGYDDELEDLTVYFTNGGSYDYAGVPRSVIQGWIKAASPGRYFHSYIKGSY